MNGRYEVRRRDGRLKNRREFETSNKVVVRPRGRAFLLLGAGSDDGVVRWWSRRLPIL